MHQEIQMKLTRNVVICIAVTLLSVPLMRAQDLSKYRQFSLGTSLVGISKQVDQRPGDATLIQQSPATLQQMEWWPVPLNLLNGSEPVQKVIFSFYNHMLYKIEAVYDNEATAGLTAADMIGAISPSYGTATKTAADAGSHAVTSYGNVAPPLAQWENGQNSVILSRDSFLDTFHLVVLTTQVNAQAEASVIEAAKQERADAPQTEIARGKKAADALEIERQENLKAFRP
jgi:hypothetical protein